MRNAETEHLTQLGSRVTKYASDYDPTVLERFSNKHPEHDYWVRLECAEFTSVCPITGQPDFGTIIISYVPDAYLVESKSLKLYFYSYRNHGDFHEDCVNMILNDLVKLLSPKYMEVTGKFRPRGGIAIEPSCCYGQPGTDWETQARERLIKGFR